MLKKILFPLVAMFMLAGCATPPTTIEVSPKITLPQQDPSLMGVTVSINGADQRPDRALAKVTRDNQLVTHRLPRSALPAAGSAGETDDVSRLHDWPERRGRSADHRQQTLC